MLFQDGGQKPPFFFGGYMSIPERLDEAMREQKENPDGTLK